MTAFECHGLWWLPQSETTQVAGILRVATDGNLRLSLVGALGEWGQPFDTKNHPIILGAVEENPAGTNITLIDCLRSGAKSGTSAGAWEQYRASRGFFGAHLSTEADFEFKHLALSLTGLTQWSDVLLGFKAEPFRWGTPGEPITLAKYTLHSPVSGSVPGGTATLGIRRSAQHNHHEHIFREEARLSVNRESAKPVDELYSQVIDPLQNLMTFVCDRAQKVEELTVRSEVVGTSPAVVSEIHVIGPRVQPEDDGSPIDPSGFEMLFTLKDVDFAELMGNWLRFAECHEPACSIFFGLQYGPPAYIEDTFLGVIQAISVFHGGREDGIARRSVEESRLKSIASRLSSLDADWIIDRIGTRPFPPLREILHALVGEQKAIMDPLISKRQDAFINGVMNTFEYVFRRDPAVSLAASHGADLYWMTEKLRFLVKACFLSELRFPDEKVASLFQRNLFFQQVCRQEIAHESRRQSM
jgi:hypothetical protein